MHIFEFFSKFLLSPPPTLIYIYICRDNRRDMACGPHPSLMHQCHFMHQYGSSQCVFNLKNACLLFIQYSLLLTSNLWLTAASDICCFLNLFINAFTLPLTALSFMRCICLFIKIFIFHVSSWLKPAHKLQFKI